MIEIKTNKPRNSSSYDPISICSLDIVNGSVRITSFTLYWTADDYHISLWSLNMWGIRWNEHGFCIVDFTAKWEKTDYYCWAQLQRLYLSHSSFVGFFFYIRALNIINKRGAGGIVAGSGCVMSNRYLVHFGFHKWKIQADLINVQAGCMTSGLYCSHNTRQIHSAASVEVNLWTQMKIGT